MNPSAKYVHFASNVSFFDFPADLPEFKNIERDPTIDKIAEQLQARKNWDVDALSVFVRKNPKTCKVIEGLFQQERFTNAQLTWFAFDVEKLNSPITNETYRYAVEELRKDSFCQSLFLERARESSDSIQTLEGVLGDKKTYPEEAVIAFFKMSLVDYVSAVSKKFDLFTPRIVDPNSKVSDRFASYAIKILKVNELLDALDARKYLSRKLIPTDSKGRHGKFATNKVKHALDKAMFMNIDNQLKAYGITTILPRKLDLKKIGLDPKGKYYCMEKKVEGIQKPREGGLKKFDFVMIAREEPKHLFEVNFYSTEGTKIGINRDEYLGLNESLSTDGRLHFHWITDGNFWLTPHGQKMFQTLLEHYVDIYNLNTFEENLQTFA
ncbi:MAG: hypothetical protein JRN67_09675 [Nitrososphaerota archaeon]|nr:hypothetical protein [Nitrososphaerota archaeon]